MKKFQKLRKYILYLFAPYGLCSLWQYFVYCYVQKWSLIFKNEIKNICCLNILLCIYVIKHVIIKQQNKNLPWSWNIKAQKEVNIKYLLYYVYEIIKLKIIVITNCYINSCTCGHIFVNLIWLIKHYKCLQ